MTTENITKWEASWFVTRAIGAIFAYFALSYVVVAVSSLVTYIVVIDRPQSQYALLLALPNVSKFLLFTVLAWYFIKRGKKAQEIILKGFDIPANTTKEE